MSELLDSGCFLGLTAAERLEQLYLKVGGTNDGCFLGNIRTTQLRLIGEVLGLDTCAIYSDADFYRAWLLFLDPTACTGLTLQGLQNAVYALLYDGTGVDPSCFLGLDSDAQEQAISEVAGGGPTPPLSFLNRTTSGLLLDEDFATLWSSTGGWTSVAEIAPISFGRLNYVILGPGATNDKTGVREFQAVRLSDGTFNCIWDGGDGTNGWRQQIGTSADKLRTINRIGPTSEGLAHISGGADYLSQFTGFYQIRGGVHIRYRITATGSYLVPGLSGPPYAGDVWTAPTFNGTYVGVRTYWETTDPNASEPCGVVLYGGVFYHFMQSGTSQIDIYTSATATGALTHFGIFHLTSTAEDPKVFYNPGIAKWVMLLNGITGGETKTSIAYLSDSLTDWSSAVKYFYQGVGPIDGLRQIGRPCHVTSEEGALVWDSDRGIVPILYDEGTEDSSNHEYRRASSTLMEFSTYAARFNSAGTGRMSEPLVHSNFVADFVVKFNNMTTTSKVAFAYRQDVSGNGYRVVIRNATSIVLEKIVAGVTTTLQTTTTGQLVDDLLLYRIKVEVIGNVHTVYIDGYAQIVVTDGSHASGTMVAFDGDAANADIRFPRIRTSDTLTITGLEPGATLLLRATSVGIPAATAAADDTGAARIISNVWPLHAVEIDGTEYSLASGAEFYGGDTLAFSGLSTAGYSPYTDTGLVLWFDASQETLVDQVAVGTVTDFSATASHVTQATAGNKPRFEKRVQNGLPGFLFDGGDYLTNGTFAGLNGVTQAQWSMVLRAAGSNHIPIATGADQAVLQYYTFSFYGSVGSPYGYSPAFPVYKTVVVSFAFDGTATGDVNRFKMWIDGVQQMLTFSGTIPATMPSGAGITFGAYTGAVIPWDGHIFETLIRTGTLVDMDKFNAYAINKWGVRPT